MKPHLVFQKALLDKIPSDFFIYYSDTVFSLTGTMDSDIYDFLAEYSFGLNK